MAMVPFYSMFHDLAIKEMRSATLRGQLDIPDGEYGFLELYCDEVDCDCRRVIIDVVSSTTGSKIWATLNYGWESLEFYEEWSKSKENVADLKGVTIDPLNAQTEYSPAFLRLFEFLLSDEKYAERLKRHYALFKGAIHERHRVEQNRLNRKKNARRRKKKAEGIRGSARGANRAKR